MSQEKTEQPTTRQLRKAREQGDSPVSAVLSQAVAFIAAVSILPAAVHAATVVVGQLLQSALGGHTLGPMEIALAVLKLSLPVVAAGAFGAAALSLAQSGGTISLDRIAPKLERLDFFRGLRGLFRLERAFGVLRALVSAGLALVLALLVFRAALGAIAHTAGEIGPALAIAGRSSHRLLWYAALLALAIGLVDWVIVRRGWQQRWMMTREEVKREHRESEGDPELKAARRRAHQEALTANMLAAVKEASVVIVNPTHLATALRYENDEDAAPRVVAAGQGELARKIVEAAHHFNVPVVHDIPVARALAELELGDEIPEALYEAVAEILRELWETEQGEPGSTERS